MIVHSPRKARAVFKTYKNFGDRIMWQTTKVMRKRAIMKNVRKASYQKSQDSSSGNNMDQVTVADLVQVEMEELADGPDIQDSSIGKSELHPFDSVAAEFWTLDMSPAAEVCAVNPADNSRLPSVTEPVSKPQNNFTVRDTMSKSGNDERAGATVIPIAVDPGPLIPVDIIKEIDPGEEADGNPKSVLSSSSIDYLKSKVESSTLMRGVRHKSPFLKKVKTRRAKFKHKLCKLRTKRQRGKKSFKWLGPRRLKESPHNQSFARSNDDNVGVKLTCIRKLLNFSGVSPSSVRHLIQMGSFKPP